MKNMSTGREGMVPANHVKQEETTSNDGVEPQSAEVSNDINNVHVYMYVRFAGYLHLFVCT